MIKKCIFAGAVAAFFAAANAVYAPGINIAYYHPIERAVIAEEIFGEYFKEDKKRLEEITKKYNELRNYRTNDFNEDSNERLIARLMMGETEDYSDIDKIAVAWTAMNRAIRCNSNIKTEILRPYQFSCFNPGTDSNIFLKIPLEHNERDFLVDLRLAKEFLSGKYKDPTNGATHYYNPDRVYGTPEWVKYMTFLKRIGDHLFYKEKD